MTTAANTERQVAAICDIGTGYLSLSHRGQVAYLMMIAWLQVRGGVEVPSRVEIGASAKAHGAAVRALARDGFCTRPRQGVQARWRVRVALQEVTGA